MDLRDQLQTTLGTAYTLERELGGGGMSRVFVAEENSLERKVVVKVLPPELTAGVNVDRFKREILLAAKLQHPHIVPVLAAGETNGLPYYTMPFVEGESLRVRLARSGTLPITDAIGILRDVAKALAYAHERGIVHRDIKPENVLLSGGSAAVADFGIAKALSASRTAAPNATLTQVGTSLGTPAYMAPEQAAADPSTDHRADIYAFGCMAYELLSGRPPFVGKTPQRLLAAQMGETPQPITELRPDTPPDLAAMVMQCLAKDAGGRPQSAGDLVHVLDSVTSGGGHPAMPPILRAGKHAMWRALAIYAVAFVVVALVAKSAIMVIGLPSWVFPGAVIVMALGLPAILFTAFVQRAARRMITMTPTYTPGGSAAPQGTIATIAMKASPHMSWRRTAIGGAYALGTFILLIGAFMLLRALGIGPEGSLLAAGKLGVGDRIVLADLAASPGDSNLAPIVGEAVRTALSQSNAVHLVPQTDIANVLQDMKRSRDTPLNEPQVVREVAARTNAAAILGGRLAQVGSGYAVSLTLTATQGGALLASYQGTANGVKDLLNTVDGLTRQLRSRVGESLKRVQRTVPLERATTTSLDALRKYSEAVVANDIDGNYPRAVELSRQAVALDPTFAMAWRKLAIALHNDRQPQVVSDSALEQATRYADRLPPLEKALVWGEYYHQDERAQDRGKALAAYQSAYALDSTNKLATNDLGAIYASRQQFDSAERYYRQMDQLQPDAGYGESIVFALAARGLLDSARALLDSMAKTSPAGTTTAALLQMRANLIFRARGQWDSMRAVADTLRRLAAVKGSGPDGSGIAWTVAMMEGRFSRVLAFDSAAVARQISRGVTPPLAAPPPQARLDIMFLGRMAEGVQLLDRVVAGPQWAAAGAIDQPYDQFTTLYAQAGQPAKARALLDRSLAHDPGAKAPDLQARIAGIRGEIALAEGKYDEAIRQFRASALGPDGAPSGPVAGAHVDYDLARTFDRANEPDSTLAYLKQYLTVPPMHRPDPDDLAAVQKRLGELYDARNERDSALVHYTAFVDQWQHADPELQPAVVSIRKRIAELSAQEGHQPELLTPLKKKSGNG